LRADRLLSVLLLLQARGKMTAQALASELEVSKRTILRDVDALCIAGIPVYAEGGHGGGIALDENYRVALSGLDEAEARSLFITGSPALLSDLGLESAAENALLKLFAALPSLHQRAAHDMQQRLLIDPTWWWHKSQSVDTQPFLPELQRAVHEDRCVQVRYERGRGDMLEGALEAYSLVAKGGIWYLVGRHDGEFRTYRVSRFHDATALDELFQRAPDFDLTDYWQANMREFAQSFPPYPVTLRVEKTYTPYLKWDLPGSYEIVDERDADWMTVEALCWSLQAAKGFVLSLGKRGQLIAPDELREAVLQAAREILDSYSGSRCQENSKS
jgi:predicted DNA-binding transcriptional regulator YafY